jgi:hypothetical protein
MFPVTSTSEEKVTLVLKPVSAAGNPAAVDGVPTWTVVNGDCTLVPSEDGLSCEIISGASDVVNEVVVEADADLDEGEVRTISETIIYTVTAPEAAGLGIESVVSPK